MDLSIEITIPAWHILVIAMICYFLGVFAGAFALRTYLINKMRRQDQDLPQD